MSAPVTIPRVTNWVPNPAYQNGLTGWTLGSTVGYSVTRGLDANQPWANSQSQSLVISSSPAAESFFDAYYEVTVGPDEDISAMAGWRLEATRAADVSFVLRLELYNGATLLDSAQSIDAPDYGQDAGAWRDSIAALRSPAGTTKARIICRVYTRNGYVGTVWIGGIDLRRGDQMDNYVDGDQGSAYGWNGTRGASSSYRALRYAEAGGGSRGVASVKHFVYASGIDNHIGEDLTEYVVDGGLDHDIGRAVGGTLKITTWAPEKFPTFSWVSVWLQTQDESGVLDTSQEGLYVLGEPDGTFTGDEMVASVSGRDMSGYLTDLTFASPWNLQAKKSYTSEMARLLTKYGMTRQNITSSNENTPDKHAGGYKSGDSVWKALQDMADIIGYQPPFVDVDGTVVVVPYVKIADRTPAHFYVDGQNGDLYGKVSFDGGNPKPINTVYAVGRDKNKHKLKLTLSNDNPDSPISTVNIGVRGTSYDGGKKVSSAALKSKAQKVLDDQALAQFATVQVMPHAGHRPNETIDIQFSGGADLAGLSGRWLITSYSIGLGNADGIMTLKIAKDVQYG